MVAGIFHRDNRTYILHNCTYVPNKNYSYLAVRVFINSTQIQKIHLIKREIFICRLRIILFGIVLGLVLYKIFIEINVGSLI